MTILETFSLRDQQIALVEINGFPVVVMQTGNQVKWHTSLCLSQAADLYGECIERILEKEVRN